MSDIEASALEPGCHVSFVPSVSAQGLKATQCRAAPGALYIKVPFGVIQEVKPIGPDTGIKKTIHKGSGYGGAGKFSLAALAAANKVENMKAAMKGGGKGTFSKLASAGGGSGRAQWEGGPNLPRKRITSEPVVGKALSWKGKVGWLEADEPINHPKASARQGHLYLHVKDLMDGESLQAGQLVTFHVYEDSSGLGAEDCYPL